MKKIIFYSMFFIAIIIFLLGCNKKNQDNVMWDKYKYSKQIGDYYSAVSALQTLRLLQEDNINVYDSLSRLYYKLDLWFPAYHTAKEVLRYNDNNKEMLNIAGNAAVKLGNEEEAIKYFSRYLPYDNTNLHILFELAYAYYLIEDYPKAISFSKKVIELPHSKKEYIVSSDGFSKVYYAAAAKNLYGYIMYLQKDYDVARKLFIESIDLSPDFKVAKENLFLVNEKK